MANHISEALCFNCDLKLDSSELLFQFFILLIPYNVVVVVVAIAIVIVIIVIMIMITIMIYYVYQWISTMITITY